MSVLAYNIPSDSDKDLEKAVDALRGMLEEKGVLEEKVYINHPPTNNGGKTGNGGIYGIWYRKCVKGLTVLVHYWICGCQVSIDY